MNPNVCKSYLHYVSNLPIEGQNTLEARAQWVPASLLTQTNVFTYASSVRRGEWVADGGDLAAPPNTRERRSFCITGKSSYTFTGTSIALRIACNPGWGKATILIDGVAPSTIAGLTTALNTVSCDSTANNNNGNVSIDVLVADGLAPGQHTIDIICYQNSANAYFVLTGLKIYSQANASLNYSAWITPLASRQQGFALTTKMLGTDAAENVTMTFPSVFVNPTTHAALGTVSLGEVSASTQPNVPFALNLAGNETIGTVPYTITVNGLYPDPAGVTNIQKTTVTLENSALFTFSGAFWEDPATTTAPILPQLRGCQTRTSWFTFQNYGDSFTMNTYTDYGLGTMRVYKNPVTFTGIATTSGSPNITLPNVTGLSPGMEIISSRFNLGATIQSIAGNVVTLTANALATAASNAIAFGNIVGTIVSNETNAALQQTMQNKTVSGFGSTFNGKVLVAAGDTKGFRWASITITTNNQYTSFSESIQINVAQQAVMPAPLANPRIQNGQVAWDAPNLNANNLTVDQPYDNRSVTGIDVEYRFPTFICCYTAGYLETFKQYDVVITDPQALTRKDVMELQALGIKVFMYVSFGEEDGGSTNIWDASAPLGPYTGDGTGPGGKAGYYMKGGHQYGETSECTFDNQRMLGQKTCAKANAHYYTGTGRCSKACGNDWVDAYLTWQAGGNCSGGYNSTNNWQRDATVACSNTSCPKYSPIHTKCPQYQQADSVYGQDFSIMDTTHPDENGVWNSYYVNPIPRGAGSWFAKLRDYYLPLVFNTPQVVTGEHQTVAQYTQTDGVTKVLGVKMAQAPFDENESFSVVHQSSGYTYTPNIDYSFDKMTGAIVLDVATGGPAPIPAVGDVLVLSYSTRGLGADGVFMDTIDTVDVYPDPVYQAAAADLINQLKALHPDKMFCANRGFTIYDKMIQSCSWVMTESVFSDYNFDTNTYQLVTDPASVQFNNDVTRWIQELRKKHRFDVVCLNYAPNDSSGDSIRQIVMQKCMDLGWLGWLSTILLNDPLPNNPVTRTTGAIRSNQWKPVRKMPVIPIIPT